MKVITSFLSLLKLISSQFSFSPLLSNNEIRSSISTLYVRYPLSSVAIANSTNKMYSSTTYTTAAAAAAAATRSNHRRAKKSGGRKSNTINKGKHDDTVIPKGSKRSSRALGDIDVNRNSNIITAGDNGGKNDRSVVIKKTPKLLLKSSAITAANNSSISNGICETTTSSKEATALTIATFPTATTTAAAAAAATIEALANENKKEKERDWKSIQKELDDLFLKTSNDRMENVPLIDIPQILIDNGVDLYQHQIDGIRWLVHKESGLSGTSSSITVKLTQWSTHYSIHLCLFRIITCTPPSLSLFTDMFFSFKLNMFLSFFLSFVSFSLSFVSFRCTTVLQVAAFWSLCRVLSLFTYSTSIQRTGSTIVDEFYSC